MRRCLLLVMILLLPLRGWAGDLMGLQMALQTSLAGSTVEVMAAMPADCPMHASAPSGAPSDADASGDSGAAPQGKGMESCSSCELCIPMAELPDHELVVPGPMANPAPLMPGASFVSAALAPRVKPPIS